MSAPLLVGVAMTGGQGRPAPPLAAGVYAVLCTPLREDGSVDPGSLDRLIDYYEAGGARGLVLASFFGEGHLLAPPERELVIARGVARRVRAEVIAGVLADDMDEAASQASRAVALGAARLLVKPPAGSAERVEQHFARLGAIAPLILLDHPTLGVPLSVAAIVALRKAVPALCAIKLEEEPTFAKIRALRACEAADDGAAPEERLPPLGLFGGLGGIHCMAELEAGADGFFTGYPLPAHLVAIVDCYRCGDVIGAAAVYRQTAPLLEHQVTGPTAIAFRKEVLRQLGVIAHAGVRPPTAPLPREEIPSISRMLAHVKPRTRQRSRFLYPRKHP